MDTNFELQKIENFKHKTIITNLVLLMIYPILNFILYFTKVSLENVIYKPKAVIRSWILTSIRSRILTSIFVIVFITMIFFSFIYLMNKTNTKNLNQNTNDYDLKIMNINSALGKVKIFNLIFYIFYGISFICLIWR